jgi:Ca2+-binding RTX toxin-like protein
VEAANGGVDTVILHDNRYFLPTQVENLVAKSGSLLVGNDLANILTGSNGNDMFIGGRGSDLVILGEGADLVIAGPGNGQDVVVGFSANDRLSIVASPFSSFGDVKAALQQVGDDTILKLADGGSLRLNDVQATDLTAAQFDLAGIGNAAVKSDDGWQQTRGGTAASELISGTASDDHIDGKGGGDVMVGAIGNDAYIVDSTLDRIVETSGQGRDLVMVHAPAYGMDAYVENVIVTTYGGAVVEGNPLANRIEGGVGQDTLKGGFGADVILGQDGDDVIAGGLGRDILAGGAGNDVFKFAATSQSTVGANADVITDFDDFGNDTVNLADVYGGTLAYRHNADFTAAGQVRINDILGVDVIVEVNIGGTLAADMQIRLTATSLASVTASDFIL